MSFKFFRKHQRKMLWVVVIVTVFTFSIFSVTSAMRACFGRPTGSYGEFTLLDGTVMPITLERQREVNEYLLRLSRVFRFEFSPAMITALREGAGLGAGIDHPAYQVDREVPDSVRSSLVQDFD